MGNSNPYDDTQEWLPEQREMAGASYSDPTYYAAHLCSCHGAWYSDQHRHDTMVVAEHLCGLCPTGRWFADQTPARANYSA